MKDDFDFPRTHDAAGKATLGVPEWAHAFFQAALPDEVVALLDGPPERLDPASHDARLVLTQPDLSYRYRLRTRPLSWMFILLELKLRRERAIPTQVIDGYMGAAHRHGKHRNRILTAAPPILPMVLCSGPAWRRLPRQADLVEGSSQAHDLCRRFAPEARMMVLYTRDLALESFPEHPEVWAGLAATTYGARHRVSREELVPILANLEADSIHAIQMVGYLLNQCGHDQEMIARAVPMVMGKHRGGKIMGVVENRWHNSGMAEGMARMLVSQLKLKFGRLPAGAQARVAKATPKELEAWAGALLTAESPKDIFGRQGNAT